MMEDLKIIFAMVKEYLSVAMDISSTKEDGRMGISMKIMNDIMIKIKL